MSAFYGRIEWAFSSGVESSQVKVMNNLPLGSRGYGLVISSESPEYLVGRILTIIEAFGLKDTQEKSAKDLLRKEVYDILSYDRNIGIPPKLHDELDRKVKEWRESRDTDSNSDTEWEVRAK